MSEQTHPIIIFFHSSHNLVFFVLPYFLPLLQGVSANFPHGGESTLRCRENRESKQADGDGRDFLALSARSKQISGTRVTADRGIAGGPCAEGLGAATRFESPLPVDNISGRGSWKIEADYLSLSRGGAGFSSPSGWCRRSSGAMLLKC